MECEAFDRPERAGRPGRPAPEKTPVDRPPVTEPADPPAADFIVLNGLENAEKNQINLGAYETAFSPEELAALELLEWIDRCHSISEAARQMNMAYRRAWVLVPETNRAAGEPLVEAATGGRRGGGANLTPRGRHAIRLFRELRDRHQGVNAVAFRPNGKLLLTGGDDNTAQLWETATLKPLGPPLEHEDSVLAVAFSPDGKTVLTGSDDTTARLWETGTGKPVAPPLRHQGYVFAVAFSPDGKSVLTGNSDRTARLWATATGKPIGSPLLHQGRVHAVAFSPDGKTLLTGGDDNMVRLWDRATSKPFGAPLQHQNWVRAAAFGPEAKTLLTAAGDTARLWETATGQALTTPLQHQGPVLHVAFSHDGKTLLMGSAEKAQLWEMATGKPLGPPLEQEYLIAVALSPDGKAGGKPDSSLPQLLQERRGMRNKATTVRDTTTS